MLLMKVTIIRKAKTSMTRLNKANNALSTGLWNGAAELSGPNCKATRKATYSPNSMAARSKGGASSIQAHPTSTPVANTRGNQAKKIVSAGAIRASNDARATFTILRYSLKQDITGVLLLPLCIVKYFVISNK